MVTDGPTVRQMLTAEVIEREIANVAGAGLKIVLPPDKRFAGDWSLEGAAAVLDRALADRDVDVVVTLGILTSQQAARRKSLPKPVIAPQVIDPVLQGYPLIEGRSGRHNFTYVADFQSVATNVRAFHDIVGFKHMVALVENSLLAALPALSGKATELAAALNIRIDIVRVSDDVNAVFASLPPGTDAVYVTPLRFSEAQGRELARGLAQRKLPTFSVTGRSNVEAGLLMTTGGVERDTDRLARRLAIMIQRIAQGEDPAQFDVAFPTSQRLVINMQVAREIGFSPRWQFLADAEQLHAEADGAQPLTLLGAMRAALDANPALAASRERLGSAFDDVRIARGELLPSISASAARTRIDDDRASPLTQAEDTTSAGLSFSQLIYSERAWAGYSIAKSLGAAQEQSQRADMLNTLTDAAVGLPERVARQVGRGSPPAQYREHAEKSRDLARARRGGPCRALRLPAMGGAARARQTDAARGGVEPAAGGNRHAAHPASAGEPAFQHGGDGHRRSADAGVEPAYPGVSRHARQVGGVHGIRRAHGARECAGDQAGELRARGAAARVELGRARVLSTRPGAGVERLEVHGQERRGFTERSRGARR